MGMIVGSCCLDHTTKSGSTPLVPASWIAVGCPRITTLSIPMRQNRLFRVARSLFKTFTDLLILSL